MQIREEAGLTGLQVLESVQYVTARETRFAVVNVDDWEAMIEWLETLEDVQLTRQAFVELEPHGGVGQRGAR